MNKKEWMLWEDRSVYDGWCLQFTWNGDIKWRDAWFVDRLSEDKKQLIETQVKDYVKKI